VLDEARAAPARAARSAALRNGPPVARLGDRGDLLGWTPLTKPSPTRTRRLVVAVPPPTSTVHSAHWR